MYIVLKEIDGRACGLNADGTAERDLGAAELYQRREDAVAVAAKHGGQIEDESRVFGDDADDADE